MGGLLSSIPVPKLRDHDEDVWTSLWRGSVSEFFATMIFIFIGCGSVVAAQSVLGSSGIEIPSLTLIALAHGFAIMVLVYAVGEVSGGHINPAVTWATMITSKISITRGFIYIWSQLLGGIVGAAFLKAIVPPHLQTSLGCHGLNPGMTTQQGFGAEVIFTFIFIFVVFATAISPFAGKLAPLASGQGSEYGPGKLTPFAVGATILILHTVGIPLTGASMNPARSFGPAVVQNCWDNHWIYWIGPLFGSTIAAIVAQVIFLANPTSVYKVFQITRGGQGAPVNSVQMTAPGNQNYAIMKAEDENQEN